MKTIPYKVLSNIPLNTKRVYTVGVTASGCEVYVPVDSTDMRIVKRIQEKLQRELDEIDSDSNEPPKLIA